MDIYYTGVDVGSVTTKASVVDGNSRQVGSSIISTGISGFNSAEFVFERALKEAGITREMIKRIIATGYGRSLVSFADRQVTEITCHARGAFRKLGKPLTLIDIGGQDTKVIVVVDGGKVARFLMNDRCAAGTGRFLEVMARVLETDLDNLSEMALNTHNRAKINSLCTVFAESEVVGLLARGVSRDEIAGGLCYSIAERISSMTKKVGISGPVFISGGVAYNGAVVSGISDILDEDVYIIDEPQLNGAYGAALVAMTE
jgi:predicted CoA-substrate-specific enzyme activase